MPSGRRRQRSSGGPPSRLSSLLKYGMGLALCVLAVHTAFGSLFAAPPPAPVTLKPAHPGREPGRAHAGGVHGNGNLLSPPKVSWPAANLRGPDDGASAASAAAQPPAVPAPWPVSGSGTQGTSAGVLRPSRPAAAGGAGDVMTVDSRTQHAASSSAAAARHPAASSATVVSRSPSDGAGSLAPAQMVAVDPNLLRFMQAYPSLSKLPAQYPIQDKFSVVMINYKRPRHLLWQMKRLVSSSLVHRVYIRVNSGRASVPRDVVAACEENSKVRLFFPDKNSLNNRFIYPEDMETEFTLSIDDDMEVQTSELEWAFGVARQFPAQITGFFPRTIVTRSPGNYDYVIPHLSKRDYPYNVVLTGSGTFFNSRWLHVYSHELPKRVRDYVDEHFNCEDIAFNMMMSNVTGLPPVLSVGSTHTTHSVKESDSAHKGLRTRHGHSSGRSECIKHLVKIFKRNPLVDSHFMVSPFTYDVPALKAILKSTQVYTQKPTWFPSKPSKP